MEFLLQQLDSKPEILSSANKRKSKVHNKDKPKPSNSSDEKSVHRKMDYFYAPYVKHENKEQNFMTFEDVKVVLLAYIQANDKMNWNPITSFVFTKNTMPFEKAMMKLSMHKIKGKRGSRLPAKNDSNLTYDLNDMIKKYSNNNQMRHRASAIQKLDLLNINIKYFLVYKDIIILVDMTIIE